MKIIDALLISLGLIVWYRCGWHWALTYTVTVWCVVLTAVCKDQYDKIARLANGSLVQAKHASQLLQLCIRLRERMDTLEDRGQHERA